MCKANAIQLPLIAYYGYFAIAAVGAVAEVTKLWIEKLIDFAPLQERPGMFSSLRR